MQCRPCGNLWESRWCCCGPVEMCGSLRGAVLILWKSVGVSVVLCSPCGNLWESPWCCVDPVEIYGSQSARSEIYCRGNVENNWNSSVVRRSPSKAIIGFPVISDYFQCQMLAFQMLALVGNARILCFKIVAIPIKAFAAQLSFNVFPLTNQCWHH